LLKGIKVQLSTDFFKNRKHYESLGNKLVYTGKIDEYFDYCYGDLAYRSLRFDNKILDQPDFLGCATVNYSELEIPYTRIIEHKHFQPHRASSNLKTVVTYEYPDDWTREKVPYYPINNDENNEIYRKYQEASLNLPNVIFGGRLAEYKYYDMHQVVGSALSKVARELKV
jgi:UDP-galactopyranose mutase